MARIIPLRRLTLQRLGLKCQLQASVDLIGLGAALRDVGSEMRSAGTTVMELHELPNERVIARIDELGWHLIRCAAELAKARAAAR